MSTTAELKHAVIVCPHLTVQDSGEITGMSCDCVSIDLSEKSLMLCGPCWEVVRARVYDSIVRLAVKGQPTRW